VNSPHQTLEPAGWKPPRGYANGIAASGRTLYLGGMIGWDADQRLVSDDFVDQATQCLRNIVAVLAEAGAGPEHLVRMTWFITDRGEYLANLKRLGGAYREVLGGHFPAMSMVQVVALMEPGAKVEVEATAVVP
jgi:enamine deaminase RidA (YjgF/YER057c/UK114 family)